MPTVVTTDEVVADVHQVETEMVDVVGEEVVILIVDVVVEEVEVAEGVVIATGVIKKDTLQENVQMAMEVAWTKVPTKGRESTTTTLEEMTVATGVKMTVVEQPTGARQQVLQQVAGEIRTELINSK